jgi:hypothetical protein
MKKLLSYLFLILVCISLFSVQSYDANKNPLKKNSLQSLSSGWEMKLAPDTENFVNVYFKTENLGCIYTGYYSVKRTTDGGNTWGYGTRPSLGLDGLNGGIFSNGNDIFTAGYLIMGNKALTPLLGSSDMGLNWFVVTNFSSELEMGRLLIQSLFKKIGFVDINYAWVPISRKTNDGGNHWFIPYMGEDSSVNVAFVCPVSVSYTDTNILYGVSWNGYIGKCVYGVTGGLFNVIKQGSFSKICVVDSSNILALSNTRIFRSVNAGVTWDSTAFPVKLFSISFPDQNTGYMTGSNGKIYKSTNKGATWISQITPTTDSLVDCCFLNTMTGYVIGANGTLLKTNDAGGPNPVSISGSVLYSDNNQPATGGYVKAIKLNKVTGNIITFDSAQIQPNGSYSLTNVPQDSVDIGVYPNSTTQNDWVMTYYPSTIYWQSATTIYPTGNLTNINVGAIRLSSATNLNSVNGKVMRLNDSPMLANLKDAVLYAKNGNTFVRCGISDASGVYHLPSLPAGNLKIICNRLGFTGDSITLNVTSTSNIDSINFYLYKVPVGIKQIGSEVPSEYKLYQNYPNPFNPATILKFQIKDSRFVTLKVYDVLGKEISTLVSENYRPGTYEVTFDGRHGGSSSLPSGIYFYRLQAGDFTETKKMLMIK